MSRSCSNSFDQEQNVGEQEYLLKYISSTLIQFTSTDITYANCMSIVSNDTATISTFYTINKGLYINEKY